MSAFTTTETQTVFTDSSQALESKVLDESQRFKELSCYTIQASSAQDFATTGKYIPSDNSEEGQDIESFSYIVVADSHGGHLYGQKKFYTEIFSKLDWASLLSKKPQTEISWQWEIGRITGSRQDCLTDTHRLGTTMTIWKIYDDRFECYWIGDSSARLYCGKQMLFRTNDHDYNNDQDIQRVISNGGNAKSDWDITMKNKDTLLSVPAKIISVYTDKINMTRSLG